MSPEPQRFSLVGLLVMLPVLLYFSVQWHWSVALVVVNVALIIGSLYYMLSPVEGGHTAAHATA